MNITALKVAMGGLTHDLGKFVDMTILDAPEGYLENNAGVFLPVWNGRYSHWHALYTAAFIEKMSPYFPEECSKPNWGKGESFIRLACAHHNPDSAMEQVITLADHVSSGMDRETFNRNHNQSVSFKDYKSTRMVPVFSHLSIDETKPLNHSEEIPFRYPLKEMTPESIFPEIKEDVIPTTKQQANAEYAALFKGFLAEFVQLAHVNSDPALWFEHFDSLLMRYTSSVPAARVGHVIPDVSLYDHLTTTAALATAIYLYHENYDTLDTQSIYNRSDEKFLLISGDFYGIQNFIFNGYGDTRKYRSKLLRGRSFSVSLMSELAADMICRKIGLPHSSVLLNAGGRFTILAPNTPQTFEVLGSIKADVNEWLLKRTFGETCIGLSTVPASCHDFEKKRFAALWGRMVEGMDQAKFSKIDLNLYGGAVAMEDYLERFHNDLAPGICPLCGKRPAVKKFKLDDTHICVMCRDHLLLGENLVKKTRIIIFDPAGDISGRRLLEPILGAYQLIFPEDDSIGLYEKNQHILKFWQIEMGVSKKIDTGLSKEIDTEPSKVIDTGSLNATDTQFSETDSPVINRGQLVVTSKFINGYVPFYTEEDACNSSEIESGTPKTLNDIAAGALNRNLYGKKKSGIEALGILKADVDHLGLLMACGLKNNLYTVSRLATLSRQLNNYFAVYLPFFLETNPRFNNVYTVFAGGDDLFLIGPWNRIIELGGELEKSFQNYVCGNPEIHFSAGITMHKAHTPMDMLAVTSEEALDASKQGGRNRITLFDRTVLWSQFDQLKTVELELAQWLDQEWITQVFLYKLNYFIDMAEKETLLLSKGNTINMADMACTRWRALLGYSVERNAALKVNRNERNDKVAYIRSRIAQWLDQYRGTLRIPLWILQYNRR